MMERDHACRAQDRFSQPGHAEQQQQHPDHELQPVQRHPID
jgi:hypothetical protein